MTKFFVVCSVLLFHLLSQCSAGVAQSDSVQENRRDDQFLLPIESMAPDDAIPDSLKALGYRWGEEISNHAQIVRYLKKLSVAAPKRTRLVEYGQSYEGRSLNYLVISSPENIERLSEIKADNLRLADPRICDSDKAKALIHDAPAIIWLAYCVHGNEISPSDAALLTAYHLLADTNESTKLMLNDLVVVIDPLQNPDGRDRFVNVFRETRGLFNQSNPYSNEHTERWPSGRFNHYWFDMNRDWFRHSQQEVKAKVAAYLDWQPQIYVDAHEMGRNSTYYFPPPTDPKNPYLLSTQNEWFSKLGQHQGKWFDRYGFGYVTREIFDAFYPGYGSEWPTLQGGLGVLWEQASARGVVIDRDDETELTYRNGVRNHYVSGLATLEFAAENKIELLNSFYDSKSRAVQLGTEGDVKHYFIDAKSHPQRAAELAAMLHHNGIEVRILQKPVTAKCNDVKNADEHERTMPKGTFHAPVAQPGSRLLRAIFDRQVDMDESFLRRQLERNELRLSSEIYDVTAWSMPLAFDVSCYATSAVPNIESELWDPSDQAKALTDLPAATVAYLVPGTDGAMKALSYWLQNGIRVHVSDKSFKLADRTYQPGTLILKAAENPINLKEKILTAMKNVGQFEVVATDTAYVQEGAHMGGPEVHWVRPPKVLLVVNRPTNYSSGHTWHLFDQVLNYPTTRVNGRDFGSIDLNKFNTIVMPDGNYSSENGFGEDRAKVLSDWIKKGGTLITMRGATSWAAGEKNKLLKNKLVKRTVPPTTKTESDSSDKKDKPEKVMPDYAPGAFLRASVFQDHWVNFGLDKTLDVFYSGNVILSETTETGGRSLVTFSTGENLLTSGFCWPKSLELIGGTPFVVYRSLGKGHVVAFTDDPNFRAMYPSLQRLFINASLFGSAH